MKKLVSTQGLLFGHYEDTALSDAINERVNDKLVIIHNHMSRNGDVHATSELSYDLFDGYVTALTLTYTIDNPTRQRLEDFRDTCNMFYEVQGFIVDYDNHTPSVFFHATDIYDMAMLIHALAFYTVCLESIMQIENAREPQPLEDTDDESLEEEDDEPFNINADRVAYSLDGKTLKFCRFNFNKLRYRVPDGVEEIEEGAFLACRHFVELSIPRSVRVIGDYLFGNGGLITIRD